MPALKSKALAWTTALLSSLLGSTYPPMLHVLPWPKVKDRRENNENENENDNDCRAASVSCEMTVRDAAPGASLPSLGQPTPTHHP